MHCTLPEFSASPPPEASTEDVSALEAISGFKTTWAKVGRYFGERVLDCDRGIVEVYFPSEREDVEYPGNHIDGLLRSLAYACSRVPRHVVRLFRLSRIGHYLTPSELYEAARLACQTSGSYGGTIYPPRTVEQIPNRTANLAELRGHLTREIDSVSIRLGEGEVVRACFPHPTGTGKSYLADKLAAEHAAIGVLYGVPTNDGVKATAAELAARFPAVSVAAHPVFDECEDRDEWQRLRGEAHAADVLVCTLHRIGEEGVRDGRKLVILQEDAAAALAPTRTVSAPAVQAILEGLEFIPPRCAELLDACTEDAEVSIRRPDGPRLHTRFASDPEDALRNEKFVIDHVASGKVAGILSQRNSVTAWWHTEIPDDVSVLAFDATSTASRTEAMSGLEFECRGADAILDNLRRVVQRPELRSVKRSTPAAVAQRVGAAVIEHGAHQRVGLIIVGIDNLDDVIGELPESVDVQLSTYFGSGIDRNSNLWIDPSLGIEHLVVAGTPNVPAAAVREELIRRREFDAAAAPEPATELVCPARGDPRVRRSYDADAPHGAAWESARRHLVIGALTQAIGRARPGDPERGYAVTVLSAEIIEGVDVRLEGRELKPVPTEMHELLVEAVRQHAHCDPGSDHYFKSADLKESLGLTDRRCKDLRAALSEAGLIETTGSRRHAKYQLTHQAIELVNSA